MSRWIRDYVTFQINFWNMLGGICAVVGFVYYVGQQFERYNNLLTLPPKVEALTESLKGVQSDMRLQQTHQNDQGALVSHEIDELSRRMDKVEARLLAAEHRK